MSRATVAFSSRDRDRKVEPVTVDRVRIKFKRSSCARPPPPANTNDNDACEVVENVLRLLKVRRANEFKDHVHRLKTAYVFDEDCFIGAKFFELVMKFRGTRGSDDLGSERPTNLDGGNADATGGARYQHSVTGAQTTLAHERVVGGRERFGKSARLFPAHVVGEEQKVFARNETVTGLRAAADDRAHAASQ